MFIDTARIDIKAGNGGNGCVAFHREKYVAAGGPDGGDGGSGGDVVFVVDANMSTLMDFRYKKKYIAPNGEDGTGKNCHGKDGKDLIIKVPVGTLIKDVLADTIIADMSNSGEKFIAARGGNGGWGNSHFATPTRQAPKFAKTGLPGDSREIVLELKLLADVGLVGFPNVGKSTLLSMVSEARPKIANYHFTTLVPNLGVVKIGDTGAFVIADIPGIIEGANEGIGLGHEFLRHVERTRVLVHVVDVSGIEGRDPLIDFDMINKEIELYNPKMLEKLQIVAANKMDLPDAQANFDLLKVALTARGYKVFPISAATNSGVRELMNYVTQQLAELPVPVMMDKQTAGEVLHTIKDEKLFEISIQDGVYVIAGKWVDKLFGSVNFEDSDSLQYFQRALRKRGVIDALEAAGISEGDTVSICDFEFEFMN